MTKFLTSIVETFLWWSASILCAMVVVGAINFISSFLVSLGIAPFIIGLVCITVLALFVCHVHFIYKRKCNK